MKTAKETIEYCQRRIDRVWKEWDYMDLGPDDIERELQAVIDFIDEPSSVTLAMRNLQEDAQRKADEWQRHIDGTKWVLTGSNHKYTMHWLNTLGD